MLRKLLQLLLLGLLVSFPQLVAGREWSDASGKFRIEAELVTLKHGKAYLEKSDGTVVQVPLAKLCQDDLVYLTNLGEYRDYLADNPLPGKEIQWSATFSPDAKYVISGGRGKINFWEVEGSRKICEFDTAGTYYVKSLAYSPDRRHIAGIPGSAGQSLQILRLPAEVAE